MGQKRNWTGIAALAAGTGAASLALALLKPALAQPAFWAQTALCAVFFFAFAAIRKHAREAPKQVAAPEDATEATAIEFGVQTEARAERDVEADTPGRPREALPSPDRLHHVLELRQAGEYRTVTRSVIAVTTGRPAPQPPSLDERVNALQRRWICRALLHADGNRAEAARLLGMQRTTLLARMTRLGLQAADDAQAME